MTIKGNGAWIEYISEQMELRRERTIWGERYTLPERTGSGTIECVESPGLWSVWKSDFVLDKALDTSYVMDEPYIAFGHRDCSADVKRQEATFPSKETVSFQSPPGLTMRAIGIYFYTSYFEQFMPGGVMDFIASIQSYDDTALMKRIVPVLRQMQDYQGEGHARRLFIESRALWIASMLVETADSEQRAEKLTLSAYDTAQLHRVLEILADRMTDPPGIAEIARMTALNEFKLKAGFRQLFGTTIYEHLRLLRMEKATELLRDPRLSIPEVGQRVGYQTPHGFNNAFRKYYGATPQQWQRR